MRAVRMLGAVVLAAAFGLLGGSTAGAAPSAPAVFAPPAAVPAVAQPAAVAPAAIAPAVAAPFVVPGTPCLSTARACVDLSANRAWLIRDGAIEFGPTKVSHGRKGFRTPPGTFNVTFKSRNHVSSIYNSPMPYSVFFNGGIAFHQGDVSGKSHGCIRMKRAAAQMFFGALGRGDVVQVVR